LRLLGAVELRDDAGLEVRRVLAQPKRLALLAFLALSAGSFRRRDTILARFWPELDTARGRAALRQALHHLRRELGADVIVARAGEELGIDPAAVWCDVVAFQECIRSGDDAAAAALYRGDLLDGLHVADAAPEWEDWLDRERTRLRDSAVAAVLRLADGAEQAGDVEAARQRTAHAFELSGGSEAVFRTLLRRTAATGDVRAVRRTYDAMERRLAREYDAAPDAETQALFSALVGTSGPARPHAHEVPAEEVSPDQPAAAVRDVAPAATAAPAALPAAVAAHDRRRRLRWIPAAAAVVLLAAAVVFVLQRRTHAEEQTPVVAIGTIRDLADSPDIAAALSELLTTELARANARVIGSPRLFEIAAQLGTNAGSESGSMSRAADAAGAEIFIEGALFGAQGGLRLDLRRIELATGRVLGAYTVIAQDAYTLTEQASMRVLADLGLQPASGRLADVTTTSVMALRFYQEGLRAKSAEDPAAARRFFRAALAEDSTFAMASFELSHVEAHNYPLMVRTAQLASRVTEREALIIRAHYANAGEEPNRLAVAESLAVRYPLEPAGHLMLGRALVAEARFLDAVPSFRRVIPLDSVGLNSALRSCRACEAYADLVHAYVMADSARAAQRVAAEYTRVVPHKHWAWASLASTLMHQEKWDEALAAMTRADETGLFPQGEIGGRVEVWTKRGQYHVAEQYLLRELQRASGDDLLNARRVYHGFLRNTGRHREALVVAQQLRVLRDWEEPGAWYWNAGRLAASLADVGRYREAAALRDSARISAFGGNEARRTSSRLAEFANIATVMYAAGDVDAVRAAADSMQVMLPRSGWERDRRFYPYVRGLQYLLENRNREAVRELERGIYSPLDGHNRAHAALAEAYLRTGNPRGAVRIMDAALRGPNVVGLAAPPLNDQRLLYARALDAAGERSRAAAEYDRVVAGWARADPSVIPRRDFAAARARVLRATR